MSANMPRQESREAGFRMPTLPEIFGGRLANGFRRMAEWRKRGVLGEALRAQRRQTMRFEALEPRLLLSADLIHTAAIGDAIDATLKVDDVDGAPILRLVDNLSSTVLAENWLDQDINVSIQGGELRDVLRIGFDRGSAAHPIRVSFHGGDGGSDELVGPDRASTWGLGASGSGAMDDGAFTGVERVTGGAGDDTFVVLDPSAGIAVDGGAGTDTLAGADAANDWTVTGQDSGTLNAQSFTGVEILAGGAAEDTFSFAPEGRISGILSGGAGADTLAGADTDNTWVITATDAGSLNGQSFAGIENLRGGAQADTFVFAGGSISGSVDGGAGANTLNYAAQLADVTVNLGTGVATAAGHVANIGNIVGGQGNDMVVGGPGSNTWNITGSNAGSVNGIAFTNVENVTGGGGSDTFVLALEGGLTGLIAGGLGDDVLAGAHRSNAWNISGADAGTLNGLAFLDIENLLGGDADDAFTLLAAGGLSGVAAGGQGADRLRGAERKTVWRFTGGGSGNAGGTGFTGMESLEGGGDEDTLVGPAEDSTWTVDGPNAGNVGGISFSGMENLEGAADNQDTFAFEASGSLSGVADGGAGGFDTLVVNGSFDTIIFTPTGPHSGYVDRDGDVIEYAGLEPVNAGDATNVVFNGDGGASNVDTWILEDSPTAGKLQLRSTSGEIETTEFAATAATITLHLGAGNDSVTIASPGDSGFTGAITVNGGADDDTLSVSDYSAGSVTFNGDGGSDTIAATKNQDFTLTNGSLSAGDGLSVNLGSVEVANLTGGATANTFTVSGWTHGGSISGAGGSDTIVAAKNQDFTLTNGSLSASDGMSLGLSSIEGAHLTGGGSANTFTVGNVWGGTAFITGLGGNDRYVLDDQWGTVIVNEAAGGGSDTLDFSPLAGDTLTVSADRSTINSSDGSSLHQGATADTQAEEIDVSLLAGYTGAGGALLGALDDLAQFIERLQSATGAIAALTAQLPLLSQAGASLAGLISLTQSFQDLVTNAKDEIDGVLADAKLSTLINALNGLTIPAPFNPGTGIRFSTDYRGQPPAANPPGADDYLEVLIDLDLAANPAPETIPLSFGADAENAGIATDASLSVDLDLTGHLTFGLTTQGTPTVFVKPGGTLTLDVDATATLGGSAINLGFLELDITGGSAQVAGGLKLELTDPNNADTLDRITLAELTTSPPNSLVSVTEDRNPLTPAIDPQVFNVTAALTVDPGVTVPLFGDLSTATVAFSVNLAGSVFGGFTPTISLTADPGTPGDLTDDLNLLDFSNVSPTEVLGMLQQVLDSFAALAKSQLLQTEIPFSGGRTVGEVLDFATVFKTEVLDPLFVSGDLLRPDDTGDGVPDLNFSSIQDLVARLDLALGLPGTLTAAYNKNAQELTFTIDFNRVLGFGEAVVQTSLQGGGGSDEKQTVTINATGGTFRLAFPDDDGLLQFTAPIAYNAPATGAGSVKTALQALGGINDGDVTDDVSVSKSGNVYTITFADSLANKNVVQLTSDATSLTGALFPVNFGASLGEIAGVETSGSFGISADLHAGLTFGIDLSPSQTIEVNPATYSNAAGVSVERPEGATNNKVQIVSVRNATSGFFKLSFDHDANSGTPAQNTADIAFNAPGAIADGAGSVEAALEALAAIGDVTVSRTEVGNHRFYVITFNSPSDPPSLLAAAPAAAPSNLKGPADDGRLSANAAFDLRLFNRPSTVVATTQEGQTGTTNEVQRVTVVNATGGTFTLTFQGQTTAGIAYDAPASGAGSVEAALEALAAIDDVGVVKQGTSYLVTFQGAQAQTNVQKLTADASKLTSTASLGTVTVTVNSADTAGNASLADLKTDVQKAVNTALVNAGLTLGFLTAGELRTGALTAGGSTTATGNPLTTFPNDLEFTLKLVVNGQAKEATGRLRAVDVLDTDASGSLFNPDGSLDTAELSAAVTAGTLATKLQAAVRAALLKAGFQGDGGAGDFNVTVDTSAGKLRFNVSAVPNGGDTIEIVFTAPVRADAGGGRISLATPPVLLSTLDLDPPVAVNRKFEVNTEFQNPAFQELGLLSAPTRLDGTTTDAIQLTLMVNGTAVPVTLGAAVRASLDALVTALQGAVNTALGLAGFDDGDGATGLVAGDVEVFRIDSDGDPATPAEGNRIGFRGKDGVVTKFAVNVALDRVPGGAIQINGAVSELGLASGTGETRRAKAGDFFLENVALSGNFSLATPAPITVTASLGFLEIEATGQGTLGGGKFIDTSIDFALKNPQVTAGADGDDRVTVDLLGNAIADGKFLYNSSLAGTGGTDEDPVTGFISGALSGGVGFSLDVEPGGPLSGVPGLDAFLKITGTSPNWFVSLPSFGDPLGFGFDQTALSGTAFALGTVAPSDGKLTENVTFVVSDGIAAHDAVAVVLAKDTSGFTTRAQLQAALQTAVNAALADLATAGGAGDNAVTVGVDGTGHLTLTRTAGTGNLSVRGPIAFSGPDVEAVLDRFRDLSFDDVLAALQMLVGFLRGLDGSGGTGAIVSALDTKLPLIDRSISDLVDIAGEFTERLEAIAADPAGSIQSLETLLRNQLGIPDGLPPILSFDSTAGVLGFKFSVGTAVELTRPFNLDLADAGLPPFLTSLVSLSAAGNLDLSASAGFDLELGLDLTGDDKAFFLVTDDADTVGTVEGTKLSASLSASGDNLNFTAGLGPFNVFVIDGSASLDASATAALIDADDDGRLVLVGYGGSGVTTDLGRLGEFVGTGSITVEGSANVELPLYIGSVDNPIAIGTPNALEVEIPDLVDFVTNPTDIGVIFPGDPDPVPLPAMVIRLPDFSLFTNPPSLFLLLSDPAIVIDGLDRLLLTLQETLNGQIFGIKLPLIGDLLANNPAANIIEDFRDEFLQPLANTIRQNNLNIDGLGDLIKDTIVAVFGPSGPFGSVVDPLTGIHGLLRDQNDDGFITADDDVLFRYLNSAGEALDTFIGASAVQLDFDIGKTFSFTAPTIGLDLGIPALGISAELTPEIAIDFNLHIGFGVDENKGFYFVTDTNGQAAGEGDPELTVAVSIDFSQDGNDDGIVQGGERANVNGGLLFLALRITDGVDVDGGGLDFSPVDSFNTATEDFTRLFLGGSVNISDPDGDGKLTIPEMVSGSFSDIVEASLTGGAVLRAHAVVDFSTLGASLANVLPSVSTEILVDFSFSASPGSGFTINAPQVVLADVTLDLGSFISSFAGPILDKIGDILEPFEWLIGPDGFLNMRIPLLSELAGTTITGADLISFFDPDNGPKVVALLDFVEQLYFLIDLVEQAAGEGPVMLNFGDLVLFDSPGIPNVLIDSPIDLGLPGGTDLRSFKNFKDVSVPSVPAAGPAGGSKTQRFTAGVTQPGSIDFPILKPENIFKLLLGQSDVTLVLVELPEFGFDFFYRQEFPIIGPLVGFFGGGVSGTLDLGFGYDTRGFTQFMATGNPATLVNGFFLTDIDFDTGFDRPEGTLAAQIAVGAGISLGLVKAGVEGGISFTIDFNLSDLDDDGKVRIGELAANVAANSALGPLAPLAIFDVSGIIEFFMRAFVEINLILTTIKMEFEFVRLTLFEFEIPFERPSMLASQSGETLTLHLGPSAADRLRGDVKDGAETIHVKTIGSDVVVWSEQFNVSESIASLSTSLGFFRFAGVTKIVADGGAGNDVIDLSRLTAAGIKAEIHGGDGNDLIIGGANGDTLFGDGGDDAVFGNGGDDVLEGGLGADKLYGDGLPGAFPFTGTDLTAQLVAAGAGAVGGSGADKLRGGDANDYLFGGDGNDDYFGGAGSDDYQRSGGNDTFKLADFGSIEEIDGAATGSDTLDFSDKTQNLTFFLVNPGSGLQIQAGFNQVAGTAGTLISHFANQVLVRNVDGITKIIGSDFVDTFHVFETVGAGITLDGNKGSDTYFFYVGTPNIDATVNDTGNQWDSGDLIEVVGTGSGDTITVTDSQITLSGTQVAHYVAPAADANVLQIKVKGNAGDDDINVESTAQTVPVRVEGGTGDDTVTIGGSAVVDNIRGLSRPGLNAPYGLGPVVLVGGEGHDTVIIDDSGDGSGDIGNITAFVENRFGIGEVEVGVVSGLGMTLTAEGSPTPGRVEFEGFEVADVRLGTGGDAFTVGGSIGGDLILGSLPANRKPVGFADTFAGMTLVQAGSGVDTVGVIGTQDLAQTASDRVIPVTTTPGVRNTTSEVVKLDIKADVGFFVLEFSDPTGLDAVPGAEQTAPIPFKDVNNAALAARIQAALEGLRLVGTGFVSVAEAATSAGAKRTFTITFDNRLGDLPALQAFDTRLFLSGGAGEDVVNIQSLDQPTYLLGGGDNDEINVNVALNPNGSLPAKAAGPEGFLISGSPLISGQATEAGVNDLLTLDGGAANDDYVVYLFGGTIESQINVFDSGVGGIDEAAILGTADPDMFLMRAAVANDGLAFIAMLKPPLRGGDPSLDVERVNYTGNLESIKVFGLEGDDAFGIDDTRADIKVYGGEGKDFFQIGQLYKSARTPAAGIPNADVFATIETTRGFLSNGISKPMTIFGGNENDEFVVYHNLAVLSLYGDDGNDSFLIRAFALKGSQEDLRERTDVSGDAGADLIMYAVNAPVNIDGGDGFDTIIVIGTEFNDDFVITENGVFGAGLNVNFVRVERVEIDAAEGDDRFFVLGSGAERITQVTGGLGSDTFFINGPTPPIVSNDLLGHSGLISHTVSSDQDGSEYAGLKAEGIASEIADNEEPAIRILVSDGTSVVSQGLGDTDFYRVVLARAPENDATVRVTALAPRGVRFTSANGVSVGFSGSDELEPDGVVLVFNDLNWNTPQEIEFEADPTIPISGVIGGYITHQVQVSDGVPALGVEGETITGLFVLSTVPAGSRFLDVSGGLPAFVTAQGDDILRGAQVKVIAGAGIGQTRLVIGNDSDTIEVNQGWFTPLDDTSRIEILRYAGVRLPAVSVEIVGDDAPALDVRESGGATFAVEAPQIHGFVDDGSGLDDDDTLRFVDTISVALARAPSGDVTVTLDAADAFDNPQLFFAVRTLGGQFQSVSTLTFTTSNWDDPQTVYIFGDDDTLTEGFHKAVLGLASSGGGYGAVTDSLVVDVGDNEVPGVLVVQSGNSTEVMERGLAGLQPPASAAEDSYRVVLTRAPAEGETVTVNLLSDPTRAQRGAGVLGIRSFERQVELKGPDSLAFGIDNFLTFTGLDWFDPQTVEVRAIDDPRVDGDESKSFPTLLEQANKLEGPLFVVGGVSEDRSADLEREPIMLPGETNLKRPLGDVVAAESFSITISRTDLDELQTVQVLATGGTFTLSFEGQTTVALAYNATAAQVQAALESLSTVGSGNVLVTLEDDIYFVRFTGALAQTDLEQLQSDPASLTASGKALIATRQPGGGGKNEIQTLQVAANAGTYTLSFGAATTAALAYNADETAIRLALEALPAINPGDVAVTLDGGVVVIEFMGALANTNVATIVSDAGALTAEGFAQVATHFDGVSAPEELIDRSIEVTFGPAKNKFRLITNATDNGDGTYTLEVGRPWEGGLTPAVPTAASKYTIEKVNPNLLVNENEETDFLFLSDIDNVTSFDELPTAVLNVTATRLYGLGMSGDQTIGEGIDAILVQGGVTYSAIESLFVNLGSGANHVIVEDTHRGQTTINAGDGEDLFDVLAISGHAFLHGGRDADTFNVGDESLLDGIGALLVLTGDVPQVTVTTLGQGSAADPTVPVEGVNELQQFVVEATGGTFTLGFRGESTAGLPGGIGILDHNATAAEVMAALEGLPTIGAGNVKVQRFGNVYRVEFINDLREQNVPLLAPNDAGLTAEGPGDILNIDDRAELADSAGLLTPTSLTGLGMGGFSDPAAGSEPGATFNEIQTLRIDATGGTFRLSITTDLGTFATPDLDHDITGPELDDALEALLAEAFDLSAEEAGGGVIEVAQNDDVYVLRFIGVLSNRDVPQIGVADNSLTRADELPGGAVAVNAGLVETRTRIEGITSEALNEIQRLTITATAGTFTLAFGDPANRTADLAFDLSAADLMLALEALEGIVAGDVSIAVVNPFELNPGEIAFDIAFVRELSSRDLPQLIVGAGGDPLAGSAAVTTLQDGLDTGMNDVQVLTVTATGGSYTLELFVPEFQTNLVTAPIAFDASADAVRKAIQDAFALELAGLASFDHAQRLVITASGGSFTLTFDGDTTAPLGPLTVSRDSLEQALENLPGVGAGNVQVLDEGGGFFAIRFVSALASQDVDLLAVDSSLLSGGTVTVSQLPLREAFKSDVTVVRTGGTYVIGFLGKTRQQDNGEGVSFLKVDATGLTGGTAQAVTRMDGINYYGFEQTNIRLGSGDDVFSVQGTSAGSYKLDLDTVHAATNVYLAGGNDQVFVSSNADLDHGTIFTTGGQPDVFEFLTGDLDAVSGNLNLDLGAGRHRLLVSDEAASAGDVGVTISDVIGAPTGTGTFDDTAAAEIQVKGLAFGDITYGAEPASGDLFDGVIYWTGSGEDTIAIDGTHTRAGERTTTVLNTGLGNDHVTVDLDTGEDGFFVLHTMGGAAAHTPVSPAIPGGSDDDTVRAAASTLPLIIFGGLGSDDIIAGQNRDIVFGDLGRVQYLNGSGQLIAVFGFGGRDDMVSSQIVDPRWLISRDLTLGGADILEGQGDEDILVGGHSGDYIDGDAADDLIFGDAARLYRRDTDVAATGDISNPRFQTLGGTQIYDTSPTNAAGGELADGTARNYRNQDGSVPSWAEYQVIELYHAFPAVMANYEVQPGVFADLSDSFGGDYIAGGARNDMIFGQLGDDTIQGDGALAGAVGPESVLVNRVTNPQAGLAPVMALRAGDNSLILVPSFEVATDGDDYIEGNGGNDAIFGNLGQDDIVGGSSSLFTLDLYQERPDGADMIFGGSGERAGRNADVAAGDAFFAERHARDADAMAGDNANIYRLVGTNGVDGGAFLAFNYDLNGVAAEGYAASLRIIPRAVELLDYTLGGPDFTPAAEPTPADIAVNPATGLRDIGAADEMHGESGDDFMYGMVRGDVMFGDAQDDNMVGGYGADWMSGGTGDDGMLGDDGRLLASRNSTAYDEPLYGIAAIPAGEINMLIATPGNFNQALININGLLKYTADLTPQNLQPSQPTPPDPLFRPLYANDIMYGGLGNDWIHSGAGDDAVSGAEALEESYTNNYDQGGTRILSVARSDFNHPFNPGNVLGYAPAGANATKFALYDANDGLRKILLNNDGTLNKINAGREWLLNFGANEGPLDTKWFTGTAYPALPTDGDDHLFGDLGNDWMVGGSGRDVMFSGWGDDLLNADDNHNTNGGLNNGFDPTSNDDTNPSHEDLAFGGAGRDVLVLNTNGDRGFDWLGEFNTFLTPYAQFGAASVNRLLQPQLPEYLYALSKSSGADQTLAAQYGSAAARNGEPFGELGLVVQQDAAWQAQTGGPRDPQAGNTHGGRVDVRNNPGTTNAQPIYATAAGDGSGAPELLTDAQLAPVVDEAKLLWAGMLGSDSRLALLDSVSVEVGNLPEGRLGATLGGQILIDSDAAGHGWVTGGGFGGMDLLTVVTHELGHLLGFDHDAAGLSVMDEILDPGARHLAASGGDGSGGGTGLATPPANDGSRRSGNGAPVFDLDRAFHGAGSSAGVDWQASADDDWGVRLSPFGPAKPAKGAWFSLPDFLVKQAKGQGGGYDSLGRALTGRGPANR